MANAKELENIYKKVAHIINEYIIIHGKNNVYDLFSNNMIITKYINTARIYCNDIDSTKVNILNAYRNNDINSMKQIIGEVVTEYMMNPDSIRMKSLLETLNTLYDKHSTEEIEITNLQSLIEYNKDIHLDKICKNPLVNKLGYDTTIISNEDYRDINIENNSIVLCYAPFRKTNILEDRFDHKGYFEWINHLISDRKDLIVLVLTYEDLNNNMVMLDDFNSTNKKKKLKLYVSNNVCIDDTLDDDF